MDEESIFRIFAEGSPGSRLALVDALPRSRMWDVARSSINSPGLDVVGLELLAQDYQYGGNAALSALLALACHRLCRVRAESRPTSDLIAGASRSLSIAARALRAIGEGERAVLALSDGEAWLRDRDGAAAASAALDRVEALVELHRVDEADQALAVAGSRDGQRVRQLRRTIDSLRGEAAALPDARPIPAQLAHTRNEAVTGMIDMLAQFVTPEVASLLREQAAGEAPVAPDEQLVRSNRAAARLEAFLGVSADRLDSQLAARKRLREVGPLLLASPPDRAAIVGVLPRLEETLAFCEEHGWRDETGDALWTLAICHKRLERHRDAVERLWQLVELLHGLRSGIADPLRRVGISARYPNLYPLLCELIARTPASDELLEAIEAGKGQVVADVRLERLGDEPGVPGRGVSAALSRALGQLNAHYLSFFVDEQHVHAALATAGGRFHHASVPLPAASLRRHAEHVDPERWGKRLGLRGKLPDDLVPQLSPLVAWLAGLVGSGELRRDDHICYSADDALHLVPLAYLELCGEPLVEWFSLSRVHGAAALIALADRPPRRPSTYVAFEAPAHDEPTAKASRLAEVSRWLAAHVRGTSWRGPAASLAAVRGSELAGQIVHFAAHGCFVPAGAAELDPNPYVSSGILLSHGGELPSRSARWPGLLSPRFVLEALPRDALAGSHVTLQACVSGLAREGRGGDALGLDWALTVAGAASTLASHWDVSAEASAELVTGFYRRWLAGETRASAWRATARELRRHHGPAVWAAFSLSGDFR